MAVLDRLRGDRAHRGDGGAAVCFQLPAVADDARRRNRVLTWYGLAVAAALLLAFVLINLAGVRWLARANVAVTSWKLAIPLLAAAGLIVFGFDSGNFTDHGGFMPEGVDGVFAAVAGGGVVFSLFGFRTVIDMAGEARDPQRTVPIAMVGAVVISLFVYVMLQIAFIGAVPEAHLAGGWKQLAENVADGPFAAFATILGLQGLAALLYIDAFVSPAGTGLGLHRRHGAHQLCPGRERPVAAHLHAPQPGAGAGLVDPRQLHHRHGDAAAPSRAGRSSSASSARRRSSRSPSAQCRWWRCVTSSPSMRGRSA